MRSLAGAAGCAALLATATALAGCGGSGSKPLADGVPTRPLGEPLVFRLDQASDPAGVARYSVMWKLNRDPMTAGSRGDYGLAGYDIAEFHGVSAGPRPGCFGASVDDGDAEQLRILDRIPPEGRVRVDLTPLTPARQKGRSKLGRTYTYRVKIRSADARLRSAEARRQLATIGC